MKLLHRIGDLIWPRNCCADNCNKTSDRPLRYVCSSCVSTVSFYTGDLVCDICGKVFSGEAADTKEFLICGKCQDKKPFYDKARSAVYYSGIIPRLIEDFKYHSSVWLVDDLTDLIEASLKTSLPWREIDVVIPVPLHPNRQRERGYNQSALLAEAIAGRIDRRLDVKSFRRIRDTEHQARLSGAKRLKNLIGAFQVSNPEMLQGRTVLLIDDVMTTESTLQECAKTLKRSGVGQVWCLTVARSEGKK